jgi:hypothetical protein
MRLTPFQKWIIGITGALILWTLLRPVTVPCGWESNCFRRVSFSYTVFRVMIFAVIGVTLAVLVPDPKPIFQRLKAKTPWGTRRMRSDPTTSSSTARRFVSMLLVAFIGLSVIIFGVGWYLDSVNPEILNHVRLPAGIPGGGFLLLVLYWLYRGLAGR